MEPFPADRRYAGLLAPVFALRHSRDLGIGDTRAVREALDFCAEHGFGVLQILPVHETLGDSSPYNPVSAHALSPALLSLTPAEVPGLSAEILERLAPESSLVPLRVDRVRHDLVHALKLCILFAAHDNFRASGGPETAALRREFIAFQAERTAWLPAWTLFRLLAEEHEKGSDWSAWPAEWRDPAAAERWLNRHPMRDALRWRRDGFAYIQWVAWRQWRAVRAHAEQRGVRLVGELSFGVARGSADTWARPDLFEMEWNMGSPPLAAFDTDETSKRLGQNWGFPPYRWERHRAEGFAWLRGRLHGERQFFHLCRIDHLRGYFRSYQFPWAGGETHAEFSRLDEAEIRVRTGGRWPRFVPGPDDDPAAILANEAQGRELITVLREAAGDMFLITEIMGELPSYLARAIEDLAVPSLVFPQLERRPDGSLRPPAEYRPLALAAWANHDHAPLATFYECLRADAARDPAGQAARDLHDLLHFAGWTAAPPPKLDAPLLAALQRMLLDSPCLLAVLMTSDLLGSSQRFNLPGSHGPEAWGERLPASLAELARDPVLGPRIATAAELLRDGGRAHGDCTL